MKKIVLVSNNPVKIKVVERVVKALIPNENFDFISLDLEQKGSEPFGKDATLKQIRESIDQAKEQVQDAEYYISMEGGVEGGIESMEEIAYVLIQDSKGNEGVSSAVSFPIPKDIALKVKDGIPFSQAVEEFFNTKGVKEGGGFVKILTNDLVNKGELYFQPMAVALSKLIHKEWFE